jgi:DNA-binding CsgD family transcriptional regulator/PAS domain-containing protein
MVSLADLTRSADAHLVVLDSSMSRSLLGILGRFPEEANEEYLRDYAVVDDRLRRTWCAGRLNVVSESQIHTEDEQRHSPVHHEFLAKLGLTRSLLSSFTLAAGERGFLGVHRGERWSAHDDVERRLFKSVLPHIEQSLRISERLASLENWRRAASACFESLPYGIVLLDGEGRIVLMNLAAREALDQADGLRMENGRLAAVDPATRARLAREIARSARGNASGAAAGDELVLPTGYIAVARPSGRRAYQLLVASLPAASVLALEAPVARTALFVSDPETASVQPVDHLRWLFGLTGAEARLAASLATGCSLAEHAGRAGISIETARSQLKQVFAKTDTHRQAELVALLSRLPPWRAEPAKPDTDPTQPSQVPRPEGDLAAPPSARKAS